MNQNPYRQLFELNHKLQVSVEKEVADCVSTMSQHTKISEGEIVNTALRRYIATHSDYLPKGFLQKKSEREA